MKNKHKFLIQAFLWLIAFNPILLAWQPLQFARFKQSTAHQTKLDLQIQPIFYTSKIPHSQQKLYEQMILAHAQHQDFQHTKTQEPRFILNLKNKEQQKALAQNWQQELVQSEQQNDQVKTFRLTRRLYAIAQTIPENNNGLNSELESCLLYEFKESYLAAKQLEQMHPEEISIKTILPLITDCAEAARQEPSIEQAFAYSDLAHNVVTICSGAAKFIGKIGTAVGKGIAKGALQSAHNLYQLTKPGHWIALAQQFKHFSVAAAHAYVKAEEFSELMFPITDKNYDQRFKSCMAQHRADSATMNTRMKETWKKLKETPWEKLTENGVALGASLILDFVTLNAVSAIASTAKTKIIEEIATIFKQEETLEKAYLVEVAGIGKMQLEGEALLNANKLKNIHQKEAELISKTNPKQSCQPKESNVQFDFDDGDFVHPSTAVGRSGQKIRFKC